MSQSVAPSPHPDLKIISSRVFRGPNIWHYEPAIQLVVDLGVLEDFPTNKLPGFADALVERLPGLMNHSCSRGRRGGFVERLHEGTWVGHVAEHVALQLQQTVGHDMRRGKTRQVKGERGRYNVIYAYYDESVGLAAGELAVRLINHLISPDPDVRLRRGAGAASSSAANGPPSARPPRPSSRKRSAATFPTCG